MTNDTRMPPLRAAFLLILLATLWAPSFLLIKIALDDVPPVTIATLRLSIAAILLYGLLRARGLRLPRERSLWLRLSVMAFFGSALPFAAISYGEQFTSSAIAAIFNGVTPIATALIAHWFISDERLTPLKLLGVAVGFAGILTIFLPEASTSRESLVGMVAFAVAALCYGISMVHARKNLRGLDPIVGATVQLGIGTIILLPVVLLFEVEQIGSIGIESAGAVLFLAIFGTAIAYLVYYRLVNGTSATFLSLVTYLLPPAGIFLGVFVRNEHLAPTDLIGCAMIIGGVGIVNVPVYLAARRRRELLARDEL